MKRSSALIPLSRDHHAALETALRLRRATDDDVESAAARFADFWSGAGERHLEIEEEIILPVLASGSPVWQRAAHRVRMDHADLRARARTLDGASVNAARILGARLDAHVRFEERVLFTLLERSLDKSQMALLGAQLADAKP